MEQPGIPTIAPSSQTRLAAEAAALYFIAGYDANAAVASRRLSDVELDREFPEWPAVERALTSLRLFFDVCLCDDKRP